MKRGLLVAAVAAILAGALPCAAQQRDPVPPAVVEVRGTTGGLPDDLVTNADLGLIGGLPSRVFGGTVGVHVFPVRRVGFGIGIGAEGLLVRTGADVVDENGALTGERVTRELMGLAGLVSLNFGHEDGWSHVSAGLGPLRFSNTMTPPPTPGTPVDAVTPYALTLNAGAGARWFLSRHVGVGFDVRFYFTRASEGSPGVPGRNASRLTMLSVGLTIK